MRDIRVDNITQSPGCDLLEHVRLFDNVCVQLVMTSQYVPQLYLQESRNVLQITKIQIPNHIQT